ncbi:MAG: TIR domain-containing protein [Oscillospiraceae bacterium]|nr:TIR domain-containing protein [Oscillospiraceae bacterium]
MTCSFRPYEGNEKYIFVSYAHVDGDIVYPIIERLHDAGFRIWFDEGIEWGSEWSESIAKHLRLCEVCIAFHSNASAESLNCRQEVNYALKKRRSILSVYLEDIELSDGLDMQLSSYQSTFWFQYQDKEQFFDRLIEKTPLLAPCRNDSAEAPEDIEAAEEPETVPVKKQEPVEKKGTDSYNIASLREESRKYYDLGKECEKAGNIVEARKWLEKSIGIREQIAGETGEAEDRKELSSCYKKMGDVCLVGKSYSEAKIWYSRSQAICEQLAELTKTNEDYNNLAVACYSLATADPSSVNVDMLKKAEAILSELVKKSPYISEYTRNLIVVRAKMVRAKPSK